MDPPLRVAVFAETYLPYLSGVTVSTESLVRGLGAAGHDVLLVAPRPADTGEPAGSGASGPAPRYAWLPSYQPPPPAPPGYRMPWPVPSSALRAVREFAPQIVHAQSPFVSGLMARRAAQRTGARLVFTHHTRFGDYRHYLGPLGPVVGWGLEAYLREYWAGCGGIVAPGTELADEIRQRLGSRSWPLVRSIPTGVEVAAIQALPIADLRAAHGWPPDSLVVVSLGRLAPEKDVELLVDGFAEAARRDERLRLLLVGGGPSRDLLAARIAAGDLAGRAALAGQLPRMQALGVIRGADLFAFASRTETQGLVLSEALAAGLPVVALAGPGVADSVRDGVDGLIVRRPEDEAGARKALARALAGLAADGERRREMAAEARAGAARFDVSRRIGQVVDLYRELLDRQR